MPVLAIPSLFRTLMTDAVPGNRLYTSLNVRKPFDPILKGEDNVYIAHLWGPKGPSADNCVDAGFMSECHCPGDSSHHRLRDGSYRCCNPQRVCDGHE